MAEFTFEEKTDMHFCYGLADGNALEARRIYQEKFPTRRLPCDKTFSRIHNDVVQTGSFNRNVNVPGRPLTVRTPELEEEILHQVEDNPSTITRKIAAELNLSHKTVWKEILPALSVSYSAGTSFIAR